jgi:D-glycero-beta-D-manno-heptose-7-phosphate kinase
MLEKIINNKYEGVTYDSIIISDYDKGFLSEKDIQFICENNKNVFIDTKKILDDWCINADFIKINHVEYERTKFNINNLNLEKKLIITLSEKGCKYIDEIFTVPKVEIKDVSGAGDTFISGLVSEYVRTKNIKKSIKFAQECATIVVQKKGVTTII